MTPQDAAKQVLDNPVISAIQAGSGLDHETFFAHVKDVLAHSAVWGIIASFGHGILQALMPLIIQLLTTKLMGISGTPATTNA